MTTTGDKAELLPTDAEVAKALDAFYSNQWNSNFEAMRAALNTRAPSQPADAVERARAILAETNGGSAILQGETSGQVFVQKEIAIQAIAKALQAAGAVPAVPEGWKLVPVEPTRRMCEAFHEAHEEYEGGSGVAPDIQWKAMLAAAPER